MITADEVLTTTRAVRKRLDMTKPVPRELINECLEIAIQAPTGSNRQEWHFVFITDPSKKRAVADLYGRSYDAYVSLPPKDYGEADLRTQRRSWVRESSTHLREHMHEAPVLLIPCIEGRLREGSPVIMQAGLWGSILPAMWSFMLAARARGLGTAWTTLHLAYEREVAEVLSIPFETVTQAGLTPIAYFKGDGFRPAPRLPVDQVSHWEAW